MYLTGESIGLTILEPLFAILPEGCQRLRIGPLGSSCVFGCAAADDVHHNMQCNEIARLLALVGLHWDCNQPHARRLSVWHCPVSLQTLVSVNFLYEDGRRIPAVDRATREVWVAAAKRHVQAARA